MRHLKFILSIVVLLAAYNPQVFSQNWDFDSFPVLHADITHLDADIRIHHDGLIEGDVHYSLTVISQLADSVVFDAIGINILNVEINESSVVHRFEDNQLVIPLGQTKQRSDEFNIRIQYDTTPRFGVHTSDDRTQFTSLLPASTRHWLPVIDHPRVEFTANIDFTYPSGNTMVSNGLKNGSELVSVDEERVSFRSDRPVSPTTLSWAMGPLEELGSVPVSGSRIYFYSEAGNNFEELKETAGSTFEATANLLNTGYPFRDLHIIILKNDHWETKNYGAGIVFLYENLGNLEEQLTRGIIAQWIGANIREEQWADASAIHMLQANLMNRLTNVTGDQNPAGEPYHYFSPGYLTQWQHYIQELPESLVHDLDLAKSQLFDGSEKVLPWRNFAELIYGISGQPYFDGFTPEPLLQDHEVSEPEMLTYTARIIWDEGGEATEIRFEAAGEYATELVNVEVTEITFTDTRTHEITFSGQSDGVVLNTSSGIENLKLSITDRDDIKLKEEKPYMFWIYQLRNDDSEERRAEAARGLASHTDNPDLQLALNDMLQMESNPVVYGDILRAIANITAGASGTDERFIQRSSNQEHPEVQKAAVEALGNYSNNDRVINRLRNIILQTDRNAVREAAIRSLYDVTDIERFSTQIQDMVTREPLLPYVPLLLELLSEKGDAETAVEIGDTFISSEFPLQVRLDVLNLLLKYDQSANNWTDRLGTLLADHHPKIRYQAADGLAKLTSQQRNSLLENIIDDEYDERVRRKLLGN